RGHAHRPSRQERLVLPLIHAGPGRNAAYLILEKSTSQDIASPTGGYSVIFVAAFGSKDEYGNDATIFPRYAGPFSFFLALSVLVLISPPPPQRSSLRLAPNRVGIVFRSSSLIFLPSSIACFKAAGFRSTTIAPGEAGVRHKSPAAATAPPIHLSTLHPIIGMSFLQIVYTGPKKRGMRPPARIFLILKNRRVLCKPACQRADTPVTV